MFDIQAPDLGPLIGKLGSLADEARHQMLSDAADVKINDMAQIVPARVSHGVDNPYQWQTEKQRRAYFATDGFGGGIPSQRTGTFEGSWKKIVENDSAYVYNDAPHATFLVGMWQQRGHGADGWPRLAAIAKIGSFSALQSAISRAVNNVINRLGLG